MLRRLWFLVPLAWLAACGGRYSSTRHDDEPSGAAGSSSAGKGSTSRAGTGSAGTSPICPCDPILCGPGYVEVPNHNGCCFHCEREEDPCLQQKEDYLSYRSALIEQFSSYGCKQDTDCVAFYIQNSCDNACRLTITGARRAVIDGLNNYATSNCNEGCFPDPKPDCGDPPIPFCLDGLCTAVR